MSLDWEQEGVSEFRRLLRIAINHNLDNKVIIRGLSVEEAAYNLLKEKDRLTEKEIRYIESLFKIKKEVA